MGDALEAFVKGAKHLSDTLTSETVFSIGAWNVSQYTLYMILAVLLVVLLVVLGGRKLQLIPKNKFLNSIEFGYSFVKTNICEDIIGSGFKKHLPFLATLFFFIFVANVIGLIPGAKATTGSISITWALAAISFIYFNVYGLRALGLGGYFKSLVPRGVPLPMVPIIWVLEFFSMVIRILTLTVRLYGNMLAGHMVLAVFSLATTIFIQQTVLHLDFVAALPAIAWFALLILMYALECLVAFLQAYVFAVLSASYVGMAMKRH